ncbi:MAG: hypothetical protein ABIZ80_26615, partial [Bryobacteraceae bacterium]
AAAAVSITGPTRRLFGIGLEKLVRELLGTANSISTGMGGQCPVVRPSAEASAAHVSSMFT